MTRSTLERTLREELPLARRYRNLANEKRGADPESLPTTPIKALVEDATSFVLRPEAEPLRAHWPFLRKLALTLAGRRAQALLHHSYGSVRVVADRAPGGAEFELHGSPHDLDLAAEAGARCLDLYGATEPGSGALISVACDESPVFWQLALSVGRSAARCHFESGAKRLERSLAVLGEEEPEWKHETWITTPGLALALFREAARRGLTLPSLRTLVLASHRVGTQLRERLLEAAQAVCKRDLLWSLLTPLPGMRLALTSCPVPLSEESSGLHDFPDFLWLERLEGRLHATPIAGHGSVPLRLGTGFEIEALQQGPCPHCGRNMLRIPTPLRSRFTSAWLDLLDAEPGLLAWRAGPWGGVEAIAEEPAAMTQRLVELGLPEDKVFTFSLEEGKKLDWLGSMSEREEQHRVQGDPRKSASL